MPCFTWQHVAIVPREHPLIARLGGKPLTLEALAPYPIVTYDAAFAGRRKIDEAFAHRKLTPDVVLAAIDADVIKTYVEAGLGVGIVANIAYDAVRDYVHHFIGLVAPGVDRRMIERLMTGAGADGDYQL